MAAIDSSKTTVARSVPTPTPRPEVSTTPTKVESAPAASPTNDQTSFSQESQESGGAANTAVNFSAWDSPSGAASATAATQSSDTDISALGSGLLKKGARGEEVEALQKMLNERTGSNLDVDGKFGNDTLKVLKQFQESQGLKADGIVGKDTRSAFSSQDSAAAAPEAAAEGAAPEQGGEAAAASEQGAQEATEQAEAAGQTAAAEQAAEGQDGAAVQEGEQAEGPTEAGEAEATSAVPGTEDTSWTEKLPKGLQPHAQAFIDAGKKYGVDPRFLAAISMQETGNGTSYSMRKRNNAMGIMNGSKHRSFKTVADSINSQANSLTRDGGYYTGKTSIAQIGATYAPVGAKNDPNNLNRHWVPNISRNFEMLGGDASGQVKGFEVNG